MKKSKKIILTVIYAVLIIVMAVSAFIIVTELISREQAKKDFSELSELIRLPVTDISTPDEPTEPDVDETPDPSEEVEVPSDEPTEPTESVAKRDIELLRSLNSDCIGWVQVHGTAIDYPVMYTPGWNEKYLKKNFQQKRSSSGTPFMEERCSLDSDNVIIYGHNMTNGTMFASLVKYYEDYEFFKNHPTFEMETLEGCKTYKIFAVAKVVANDGWYYFVDAENQKDFEDWVYKIKSVSHFYVDYTPEYGDSLVTLSTCYGAAKNGRLIVVGAEIDE